MCSRNVALLSPGLLSVCSHWSMAQISVSSQVIMVDRRCFLCGSSFVKDRTSTFATSSYGQLTGSGEAGSQVGISTLTHAVPSHAEQPRHTCLEWSIHMEHKTFLPRSLKSIFHEEENLSGKTVEECKAIEKGEQNLIEKIPMEETIENRLPLLSSSLSVI